jgi:ribonuclease D
MPGSLGELDSIGLSGSEIRFHGKTLLALVAKALARDRPEMLFTHHKIHGQIALTRFTQTPVR